ncbi:hypothetical protein [Salinisphaera dokdonensis]
MQKNTIKKSLLLLLLASSSSAALAEPDTAIASGLSDGAVVIAQAKAVDTLEEYQSMYRGQMMDRHTMQMLDVDDNGEISREEFMHVHELIFDTADQNKDGKLEKSEMKKGSLPEMETG